MGVECLSKIKFYPYHSNVVKKTIIKKRLNKIQTYQSVPYPANCF